jgi:hypothetical protein
MSISVSPASRRAIASRRWCGRQLARPAKQHTAGPHPPAALARAGNDEMPLEFG